jgi:hypothetical protein
MKVYFDANFSSYLADALNLLEKTNGEFQVFSTTKELKPDSSDEEIVLHVSENKGVLFTKDSDFRKTPLILELMRSHNIGLFYMKPPKKEVHWDTIVTIIRAFNECREKMRELKIPYCFEITAGSGKLHRKDM